MGKVKLFFKWTFVFGVLSIWTFLVLQSLAARGLIDKDFNIPIYIKTDSGTEFANSASIIEMLFFHEFEIEKQIEIIPDSKCSLRGTGGVLEVNGIILEGENDVNLNINKLDKGKGSVSGGNNKNRFSSKFDVSDVTQNDNEVLMFEGEASSKLNREKLNFSSIVGILDRNSSLLILYSEGNSSDEFRINDMNVNYVSGCSVEQKEFYLITDNGKLEKRRSIGDVRELLKERPELIDAYEGLKGLFNDYWWLIVTTPNFVS